MIIIHYRYSELDILKEYKALYPDIKKLNIYYILPQKFYNDFSKVIKFFYSINNSKFIFYLFF